ncbi:hypothetical protein GCM10011389_28510 [Pontibacillus salipaludis]|uniref:Uncharacterized protein n=1 Tax=Pontibacillus salipaludis TaxID=1697394 RepID=A0ABQ1QAS3_9BACI|nr:hypothetical protein GCM10011389_28510 [Pontibacillus salipaludis]
MSYLARPSPPELDINEKHWLNQEILEEVRLSHLHVNKKAAVTNL